ncbi:acyltransferase family protein, partial [Streptomyces sp.]|uniref:acyltransferase family protein n=1 Tax=Streptomyces sp. TaxID=1931 RepID=UPI002F4009ED
AEPAPEPGPGTEPTSGTGPGTERPDSRRFAAVDGLRGLAVLAVLLYDTGWFSGARLGIDVLLVLSGFLVTLTLIRRVDATRRTGAGAFLARRFKRLFPALLVVLAVTLALCCGLGSLPMARNLSWQIPAVLFQYTDWAQSAHHQTPWAAPVMTAPLAALWPLSVTAWFCLVWPLLLGLLCFLLRRRIAVVATAVVLLLVGSAAAPLLYPGGFADAVVRVRAVPLLAGSAVACAVHLAHRAAAHGTRRRNSRRSGPAAVLLPATGFAALAVLVAVGVLAGGRPAPWPYPGAGAAATAVAVCAALLTAVLCTERGPLARLLSASLLTELGRMSYSVYLLHLPVYWLLRRGQPGITGYALLLVGGAVTWFLALFLHYLLTERLSARPWRAARALPLTVLACTAVTAGAYFLPVLAQGGGR